jgi:hypothetical protein
MPVLLSKWHDCCDPLSHNGADLAHLPCPAPVRSPAPPQIPSSTRPSTPSRRPTPRGSGTSSTPTPRAAPCPRATKPPSPSLSLCGVEGPAGLTGGVSGPRHTRGRPAPAAPRVLLSSSALGVSPVRAGRALGGGAVCVSDRLRWRRPCADAVCVWLVALLVRSCGVTWGQGKGRREGRRRHACA